MRIRNPFKPKPFRPYDKYWLAIMRDNPPRAVFHVEDGKDGGQIWVKFAGNEYVLEPKRAFLIRGWDPTRRKDWFSTLTDLIPDKRVGLVLCEEPHTKGNVVFGLDRLAGLEIVTEQTPFLVRVFTRSKLYERWIRKLSFGMGINAKYVIIMLIVLLAVVVLMFLGGQN